ncbi:glycosyltransferase [Candidatus Dependentiae bacterium]|nr:glycosyltransferase [Candidatus Dependentiae bacterium]
MQKPIVSVVLGSLNRYKFLKLTIKSVREELKRLAIPSEIIVIDGGSTDRTIKWLTKQKDIISTIQYNQKPNRRSWGYFMNLGFKSAQGKYICMISDDCLLVPNAIVNGYKFFEEKLQNQEKVGSLAFYWRNIPFHYHNWTKENRYNVLQNFDRTYVNHGMYLKKALEEVSYIDEEKYSFYAADTDLCFRMLQKGYSCLEAPNSYVEHYFHANIKQKQENSNRLDQETFNKKWAPVFGWPENKCSFSCKEKEYLDPNQTVKQFTHAHFTNFEFWSLLVKDIIIRRKNRVLNIYKKLFTSNKP